MKTYIIDYVVGHSYRKKRIKAENPAQAIKKSRLTSSIVDIQIEGEEVKDPYLLRDF